ncbi:MAG: type II toxin-antitoxin system RelE/ParE family toxin [Lachnospiraceae bacterium]|nr:type II toxin-antitoxin system RelE/ParE family toxin [Lachnospiraceae bacterium]
MASERFTYRLTKVAEADIDETLSYITNTLGNPDAATTFVNELEEKLGKLCKSPKTGKLVENEFLTRRDVRRILVKNYIAYYFLDEINHSIVILRVVYGRRDQDKIIGDF